MTSFELPPDEVLAMDAKITAWEKTLPEYFVFGYSNPDEPEYITTARYRLTWRLGYFRLMLLTPLVLRWASEKSAGALSTNANTAGARWCRQLGLKYAHLTVTYVEAYFKLNIFNPMHDWYAM